MTYVALIAGQGAMPIKIIEELQAKGEKVLLLGIKGLTPQNLTEKVDKVVWGGITRLGKARSVCKKNNVKEIVMGGLIKHNNVFSLSLLNMDLVTMKAFMSLADLRADTICSKIVEVFQNKGISFLPTTRILKRYLASSGVLTHKKPSKKILEDIQFGLKLAKELGRLDIGQCVVIKNKSVVALEAMEGTDQCLQRSGDIAGENCVVVKLSKPQQDTRFDVPVIGKNTIEKLIKIKAAAIAIEAEKTLIIDDEVIALANEHGIIIVSVAI
ncbi:MAG: UDP-2,3-diacylglucosamine pyrophosphatase LpxI [Chlamydiae bacterium]|nr:UDP-2,3-diacylglucosamine pyrophosphatase LpxI [Chlamydiota bacterium]